MRCRLGPPPVAGVIAVGIAVGHEIPSKVLPVLGRIVLIEDEMAWIQLVGHLDANQVLVVVDDEDGLGVIGVLLASGRVGRPSG